MSTKIEDLESIVEGLVEDRNIVVEELGELLVHCDRCNGGDSMTQCFKCSDTGIIKKKQLYDWPW